MSVRVDVKPELLRWARERAGADVGALVRKFPRYREWEDGEVRPTYRQLENFAKTVHAGVGYFFLSEPPDEPFPIPDFRTMGGGPVGRPSLNLRHTIYLCQNRQDWYEGFARAEGEEPLPFVGSAKLSEDVETAAARMRRVLKFDLNARRASPTWTEALRRFIELADEIGVLVMVSGVVGNNPHRRLAPEEFRGFALANEYAPLVFINGADTKAAQMFTLAHELAHLWLGETALSDSAPDSVPDRARRGVEIWCNRVAAELLAPIEIVRAEYRPGEELSAESSRLARRFKVSTLVILRRIYDIEGLPHDRFRRAYDDELERLRAIPGRGGGNFYATQTARVGKRFAYAAIADTLGGRTSFREAFQLFGFSKTETFKKLADNLGVRHGLPD